MELVAPTAASCTSRRCRARRPGRPSERPSSRSTRCNPPSRPLCQPPGRGDAGPPTRPARVHLRVVRSGGRHRRSDDPQGRPSAASGSVVDDRAVDQAGGLRVPAHGLALWPDVGAGGHANISDDGYGLDHHGRCAPDRDGAFSARPALSLVRPQVQLDGRQTMRVVTDKGEATTVLARPGGWRLRDPGGLPRDRGPRCEREQRPDIHVIPATFTVRTVPAIAGLPLLRVDGGRHCRPRRTARSGSRSGGPPVRAGSHPASGGTQEPAHVRSMG